MEKIMFCKRCNKFYVANDSSNVNCPECNASLVTTGFTKSAWKMLSGDEKKAVKKKISLYDNSDDDSFIPYESGSSKTFAKDNQNKSLKTDSFSANEKRNDDPTDTSEVKDNSKGDAPVARSIEKVRNFLFWLFISGGVIAAGVFLMNSMPIATVCFLIGGIVSAVLVDVLFSGFAIIVKYCERNM